MTPSPRATRSTNRSSSSSSNTPLDDQEVTKEKPKKRKAASPKANVASPVKEKVKSPSKVKGEGKKQAPDNKDTDKAPETSAKKAKKTSAPKHQVLTERDEIPKLWDSDKAKQNGSYSKSNIFNHFHNFSAATSLPVVAQARDVRTLSSYSRYSFLLFVVAFKIASWNVAGLRAVMRNHPDALADLVQKHDLDVLCLQETKLQENHLDDPKLKIRGHLLEEQGYDAYYTCSTAKKGYAGTAVFVRRRPGQTKSGDGASKQKQKTVTSYFKSKGETPASTSTSSTANAQEEVASLSAAEEKLIPQEVSYEMGKEKHDVEGRLVIVDFPSFSFCNLYVPNSGQKLERLAYRTDEWDKDLLEFMQTKQKERGVPVMFLGDLNVAHTNLECWNDGAKHLAKQAGTTPEERDSFQAMLDAGFVDAFRKLHPTVKGHYSYWSQRAGNREPNKGLRLDYFVCDPSFFDESSKVVARDSYVLFDQIGSDHCPVVLELEIKP